ncbi:dihydroorotase [uncultured Kordia sp.]|uniref:dihydroorotase n=1 Tax=uncultured Kordia sp. TaxID=507699 RepID=UPI00260C909E|nr:dihydroorotase [uncultured Kordia sp.]
MKKILLVLIMGLFSSIIYAQSVHVGDTFTIGKVANDSYDFINFPKANLIQKKGGIANYTNVIGEKVEVTSIKKQKDGSLVATIKLASKKLFFNSHKYITVAIDEAINKKELIAN